MLKAVLKTFGMVLGSGLVLACVTGLISWRLLIGDPWVGLGIFVVLCFSYPIGLIIGIVLVKKLLRCKGSLLFGILGFILGVVLVGVIVFFLGPLKLIPGWAHPAHTTIEFILVFIVVPLSFTLGYCLVKKGTGTTR